MIQTERDGGRDIETKTDRGIERGIDGERTYETDRNRWEREESELERNIQIEKERMRQTETDGERANVTDRERWGVIERERERSLLGGKMARTRRCPCVRLLYTSVGLVLLSRVDARSRLASARQCYVDPNVIRWLGGGSGMPYNYTSKR
jgi:hypothetical protein